jgi:hypothetical protein
MFWISALATVTIRLNPAPVQADQHRSVRGGYPKSMDRSNRKVESGRENAVAFCGMER